MYSPALTARSVRFRPCQVEFPRLGCCVDEGGGGGGGEGRGR